MELRVLRYFLAVTQYQNMTRAAKELLVSQPTLSKQLADLENELGTKLFIRGHRHITLTEEGQYLQSRAKEMVQLADQTTANIRKNQAISGTLSIGAGESIRMQRIMRIISNIVQDYPDIKIHLISGNGDEMEKALDHGTIDFAVFMGHRDLSNFNYLRLPEVDQWGIIMLKDDPLSNKTAITPQDLLGHPLIVSEQGLQEHRFQDWWGNLNQQMNIIATFSLLFNAQLLVENTGAYMFTFDHLLVNSHQHHLIFRPLSPKLVEPITIVWKKNTIQSKAAQLLIKRLKTTLNK
ncbi:LysR family transcriptional regulator [Limosilactobacillus fastidiosus]|uniref:LysR family transcriptional regulator n=1 Tax=Limosilactobacillus fastidiosus TaxID=2759855 RepID=A0A7W3YCQ2_9LACO|nr:LysR family transcriptional regulator [Limosilactobacillus fastidiosus]MBB1086222.1 LysR family transcriptional regulator [Limosilactobacillus fastidiosus]MCD7086505.1 LysR family transcriptional regulator [Limosilactobacillus fastidiosus]MCD7114946.1 LysR family transcriptional regulator [Limosilactobacillus fastidiosus]MCD7116659.1 LysR family transcriptional regulator [Limosilactobacillus fastidiosus]